MKQFKNILILICASISSYAYADLNSDFDQAYTLNKQGDIFQSCQLYRAIVKEHPWCTQAVYNLAHTLKDLGLMPEAIDAYKIVIAREPQYAFAHMGLSQCYLSLGDYHKGFELFEWRSSDIKAFKSDIEMLKHLVASHADLTGKKILLRGEWGMGDILQFIRFARPLKERGATVMIQSYPALKELLSLCPYFDKVISVGDAFPEHNIQIPVLSLAYICDVRLDDIEQQYCAPYMYGDKTLIAEWHDKLGDDINFRIGICWCGNGDKNAPALLNKNIALSDLQPLLDMKGLSVYSLQQLDPKHSTIAHLKIFDETFDHQHGRFMDTAAVMHNLDLVITIDTSIAHLAGAMNIPVWVLLPNRTDWRWMLDGTQSPWYKSMKLCRQPTPSGWQSVIQDVCQEIKRKIQNRLLLKCKKTSPYLSTSSRRTGE